MKQLTEVEALFVKETLDNHGEYICDLLTESIERLGLKQTDDLLNSIDYKVERRGEDFVLSISFLSYGRAVEILSNKSRRKRRKEKLNPISKKQFRRAKQKDTRFYAKNVYGSINRLLGKMSSEYSDAEIERLKGILQSRQK